MYGQKEFGQNLNIVEHSIDVLHHVWLLDQSTKLEYATFQANGCTYMQFKRCTITNVLT